MFKRIFILVVTLAFFASAANVYVNMAARDQHENLPKVDVKPKPIDTKVFTLSISDTTDTLADGELRDTVTTGGHLIVGPFPLAGMNEPRYTTFAIMAEALTALDTFAVAYILTRGGEISDTTTGKWVTVDSLNPIGASQTVVTISDEPGNYIFFKFHNFTAAVASLREVYALFTRNYTYNKNQ